MLNCTNSVIFLAKIAMENGVHGKLGINRVKGFT